MRSKLKTIVGDSSLVFNQNVKITQLGKSGRIQDAIKIFNQMTHRNTVTWNSMISAYSKNGRISDARHLFDEMPQKNLVSWNTMIAGYLHNDRVKEAAELFDKMPHRDLFSWTLMITCYTRNGELEKARYLFDRLPHKRNPACWNAMIAGNAKNRRLKDARKLFDEMPVKDLISWNSMLAGYTQNIEMGRASELFFQMEEKDVISWNLMVQGYVEAGDMDSALCFFRRIANPNVISWVTLLSGYARNGQIEEARGVFDEMPERNVVSWNAMVAGYCQNCRIDEAAQLFKLMPERNSASWTAMINGYVSVGKLDEARKLLDQMPYKNVAAQTAMISGYLRNMKMNEARLIFDHIDCRDVVCWNSMIAGYVQCGRMDEAIQLFKEMPKKNLVSWNTLIAGYAQEGKIREVIEIFENMEEKNKVTWNSLISGFNQNGLYMDGLRHLVLMSREGMKPDQSTFTSCLSASANLATLQMGRQLHHLAMKTGYDSDLFVRNALITMYSKCGRVSSAKQVFSDINAFDIVSWNSMIAGYALNGYGKEAVQLFQEMEAKGLSPDQVTFVGVLSACSHAGLINQGLSLFQSMTENYSIEPLAEHYACMVDLLGRAGRVEEAYQLVMEMPIKANAGTWGALLGACRMHRRLELGKLAAEKLFEFEPRKTSNYVILSNMNAEAGKWNEVERLRRLMKERGVDKQAGCSWVELKNEVHSFISDDSTQLKTVEIIDTLKNLTMHIRNTGYIPDISNSIFENGQSFISYQHMGTSKFSYLLN